MARGARRSTVAAVATFAAVATAAVFATVTTIAAFATTGADRAASAGPGAACSSARTTGHGGAPDAAFTTGPAGRDARVPAAVTDRAAAADRCPGARCAACLSTHAALPRRAGRREWT